MTCFEQCFLFCVKKNWCAGAALPFTRNVHGRRSQNKWEMDRGEMHRILQSDGGEQGDPMMPLLHSLGQNGAPQAANNRFTRGERLFATNIVTPVAEVGTACVHVQDALCASTFWKGLHRGPTHFGHDQSWPKAFPTPPAPALPTTKSTDFDPLWPRPTLATTHFGHGLFWSDRIWHKDLFGCGHKKKKNKGENNRKR